MKYSTRLSDAVHILAFIALYPNCDLTSNKLAESIQTNPAYVRQLMSALRKGGLLVSVKGHPRPALAREPEKITLLDAYRAVEGDKPLLHQDVHTNPACGVGVNIQLVLRDFYLDIQKQRKQRMQEITLKECAGTISHEVGRDALAAFMTDRLSETLPFGTKILLNGKYRTSLRDYTENRRDLYPVFVFYFPEKKVSICRKSTMSQA